MTESRRDYLREGGTQRARRIGSGVRLHPQIAADDTGDMAELVDQGTLLCRDQQQQETQCFDHVSHRYRRNPNRDISTLTEYCAKCTICGARARPRFRRPRPPGLDK
jgi:hypothetical protein